MSGSLTADSPSVAFFDFDGTLLTADSFILFARYTVGRRRFLTALLLASPWIVLWKLGIITGGRAKERLFRLLYSGMDSKKWHEKCRGFVRIANGYLNDRMCDRLKAHQAAGHKTVIVTASVADWVRPWAEGMGVDMVLGTEIEIDPSGKITGRFSTPNCHGKEKARRVEAEFPHLPAVESWSYGDSPSDRHLCAITTHGEIIR